MNVIEKVNSSNLESLAGGIAALELIYPENLRSDRDDIAEMLSLEGSVAFAALSDGIVAGAVFGFPPDEEKVEDYFLSDIVRPGDIYLESITVGEALQGQGMGLRLIRAFADGAREAGYRRIVGHFRRNGSLALAKKIGGAEVRIERDWFGTGEEFVCCVIDLPA